MSMKLTVDKKVWNNLKKSFAKAEKGVKYVTA